MKLLRLTILCLLLLSGSLEAKTFTLKLEHAREQKERAWGLMGRRALPQGSGMLFHYPKAQIHEVWAFNCFIDLSVAFLDDNLKIVEIQTLKAYPEKMDPRRPVLKLEDLYLYPLFDPITQFFSKNRIISSEPTRFILEVPLEWFKREGIDIGDQLKW